MQDLNRVQLIGHLGQDPETKYTGHRYSPDHLQRSDQRSLEGCGRPRADGDGGVFILWPLLSPLCQGFWDCESFAMPEIVGSPTTARTWNTLINITVRV